MTNSEATKCKHLQELEKILDIKFGKLTEQIIYEIDQLRDDSFREFNAIKREVRENKVDRLLHNTKV